MIPAAPPTLLYLSSGDIAAMAPDALLAHQAVRQAFAIKAAGRGRMAPKTSVTLQGSDVAMAMVGLLDDTGVAGVKWLGVVADNPAFGLASINGLIVLSDKASGLPRAILDAGWITATRTAACTGVAAAHLARPGSDSLGFVGCGLQAHAHLDALRLVLPDLKRVAFYSRGSASTQGFARRVEELGLEAQPMASPQEAVGDVDVVVTSVPPSAGLQPFLEAGQTRETAFISAVDLGRTWKQPGWRGALTRVITDDVPQSTALIAQGKMMDGGPFDGEIGDLFAEAAPATRGRNALLFAGIPLGDIALAAVIEQRARAEGRGLELPR